MYSKSICIVLLFSLSFSCHAGWKRRTRAFFHKLFSRNQTEQSAVYEDNAPEFGSQASQPDDAVIGSQANGDDGASCATFSTDTTDMTIPQQAAGPQHGTPVYGVSSSDEEDEYVSVSGADREGARVIVRYKSVPANLGRPH